MNEQHPNPSLTPPPPPIWPTAEPVTPPPLGSNAAEQVPITGVVPAVEAVLRQPRRVMFQLRQARPGPLTLALLVIAVVCSLIYGFVVGTFSMGDQLWAAPAKIGGGLVLAALICLPSLYIFACLSGAEVRLGEVAGFLTGQLALTTVLLIGFAPVAWVFSQSTESVAAMGALHLVFGLIAAYFGLRFLNAAFRHVNGKPSGGLKVWMLIYILVLLQMTTALRPIVGEAEKTFLPPTKKFFLSHWADCLKNTGRATAQPAETSPAATPMR
jgi:hypothetical protein